MCPEVFAWDIRCLLLNGMLLLQSHCASRQICCPTSRASHRGCPRYHSVESNVTKRGVHWDVCVVGCAHWDKLCFHSAL